MAPFQLRKTPAVRPHGPTDYGRYRCERITDPFRFRDIAADWGRLHRRSGGSVFSHHALLMAKIETSIEKRRALCAVTLWDGDCLARRRERIARKLRFQAMKLTFLDQFDVGWNDVLLDPDAEGLADVMVRASYDVPGVKIADFFPLSPYAGGTAFRMAARRTGRMLDEQVEMLSSTVDLEGGQEGILARRSKNTRTKLRQLMRRTEGPSFRYLRSGNDDAFTHELLDEALEMSFRSWKADVGTNIGARGDERSYLHRLLAEPPEGCHFYVDLLRRDGEAVAFALTLTDGKRACGLITDYDKAYQKESYGRAVFMQSIYNAAADGAEIFDTMRLTPLSENIHDDLEDLWRCHLRLGYGLAPLVVRVEALLRGLRDRTGLKSTRVHGRRKFQAQE
jgi:CelD/BcsL family acetyltransferase involved in cellulose biosynthesis